ncbi:MAG TPA: IclR family transcriptional regulator [Ancylobacter sp.]
MRVLKASGAQALERGLALLEVIAQASPQGLRLSEAAERCNLEPPTAHRLVTALERAGFVRRVGDTKRLRLGLKLFQLASAGDDGDGLLEAARPSLLRLVAQSGDCIFLMARSGLDAVCLDRQDGDYTIRSLTGHVGGATPLGLGTGSTTILAYLPARERTEVLAANRQRILALGHELPSEAELSAIQERGYCHEISKSIAGIVGAAVPIMTPKGRPIAALAIGATEARLTQDRLADTITSMQVEARLIEASIAFSGAALRT